MINIDELYSFLKEEGYIIAFHNVNKNYIYFYVKHKTDLIVHYYILFNLITKEFEYKEIFYNINHNFLIYKRKRKLKSIL